MNAFHRTTTLLLLVLTLLTLGGAGAAAAAGRATWASWHVQVSFAKQQPQVIWTSFVGDGTTVLGEITHDLTKSCKIPRLRFDGDYAIFDGATSITCPTPDFQKDIAHLAPHLAQAQFSKCECSVGKAPFWAAADVRLDASQNRANPLFFKERDGMSFGLPVSNDSYAQTRLALASNEIATPFWPADPRGNQVWLGNGGAYFPDIASGKGWSAFMDTLFSGRGRDFLLNRLPEDHLGYWVEDAGSQPIIDPASADLGNPGDFGLKTAPDVIVIGHDPRSGAYFHGAVRALEVDPGCRGH